MAKPLALTMGEPAGIGGEIALKCWLAREKEKFAPFFLIDDHARLLALARELNLDVPLQNINSPEAASACFPRALPVLHRPLRIPVTPGTPNAANAPVVIDAIKEAVTLAQSHDIAGIVTNPIHKPTLQNAGFAFPGHTEFIAHLCNTPQPVMILACPILKVVLVTVHLALRDAARALTTEKIVTVSEIAAKSLTADFGIAKPRLVIAGLNPHAGDDGALGREEREIIAPAVALLKTRDIDIRGPLPADTLFHADARMHYDAAVCMYHDQGLIPIKTLDFTRGVNITLGLPIVRTSPDHGTAFDIAGKGIADPASLSEALAMATHIFEHRQPKSGHAL